MRIYTYDAKSQNSQKPRRKKTFRKSRGRRIFTWIFRALALGIVLLAGMFLYYSHNLPDPNQLLDRQVPESTKIYARDGSLLYEIHGEYKRTLVTLDQINPNLKNATVAIEDKNFYKEGGISITGILRAALADIISLKASQGGSTITQQFVKNAILTDNKSWDRKIREAILAVAIDARFSKDQILQLYLNEVPYGRNAYGVEAAAQTYFGKSAKDLDLAQSAYLAAMVQAPTYYNPTGPNRTDLDARKNTVLALMQQQGYITADQEKQAQDETVAFAQITNGIVAPHFVLWVQNYLANKYGETTLEEGGLKVYTTLDPRLQQIAETVVLADVDKESKKYNANNAALVAIDPKTGEVLAMVGSKDYFGTPEPAGCTPGKNCTFEPNVNVALSERQPGSSFKPYVYVTAFGKDFKYTPASVLYDVTTNFGTYNGKDYIPGNYNGINYGAVSIRQALGGSLNVPAVKMLDLIGVDNAVQTAHTLGITSPLTNCGLSLVLGGCEVNLLDHVAAYSVFANDGVKNPETPILKIEDKNGATLEQFQSNPQQVLDPEANYELISILTDNTARSFIFGANSPLTLPGRTVAAKTGTTQNWHDGWTIGFTPSLVAGVWAGNNDGTLLKKGADGVVVAAPIWHDFMVQALATSTPEDFPVPPGIQHVTIDTASGLLPTQYSSSTKSEVFADYSVPTQYDNVHVNEAIDSATGLPANNLTPPGQIIYKVCSVYHSEMPNNPNWEQPVQDWAATQPGTCPTGVTGSQNPPTSGGSGVAVNILTPADGDSISQPSFTVSVSATSPNQIARVDLSVDGQFYQSLTQSPFVFTVNKALSVGNHSIAAHAVDQQGQTADTSISINFGTAQSQLQITDPAGGGVSFPLNITAESGQLSAVTFYYQKDSGSPVAIGPADNVSHPASNYEYTVQWAQKPAAGSYKIYAQTNTGVTSPKINITVP